MTAYDLAIIGSGPGGYVAAIRGAQLDMRVALIEEEALGGVCLNWGCIPTKSILNAAQHYEVLRAGRVPGVRAEGLSFDYGAVIDASRKAASRLGRGVASLMRKNRIDVIEGRGRLAGNGEVVVTRDSDQRSIEAENILLATGSAEWVPPGVEVDGRKVLTSREALEATGLPDAIVVVGAGPVGLEFAYVYATYGVRVTLLEMADQLLPGADHEVAEVLERSLTRRGVRVVTRTAFRGLDLGRSGVTIALEGDADQRELRADQVLLAMGRRARIEDLGLEEAGVAVEAGFIRTSSDYQTTADGVRAIGDVIGPPLLAHKASEQGKAAVELVAGERTTPVDLHLVPACVYCEPQVASVGICEAEAEAAGREVKVGRFPFLASGKAVSSGHTEGFVKMVSDARSAKILGCQAIGAGVTELIAEVALAMALESTVHDIGHTCHAHPTLSEAIMEAALASEGGAIHV
jgi:dihydrolipoamide dehydrogenase